MVCPARSIYWCTSSFHQHVLDKPQDVQSEKTELPIAQLGMILDVLFQDEKVANRAFPKRKAPTQVKTLTQQKEAPTLYPASWKVRIS